VSPEKKTQIEKCVVIMGRHECAEIRSWCSADHWSSESSDNVARAAAHELVKVSIAVSIKAPTALQ
jgi:hypothetical protein